MAKKQGTKKHTQVKGLPRKAKKLTTENLKKVKGGWSGPGDEGPEESITFVFGKLSPPKPLKTK